MKKGTEEVFFFHAFLLQIPLASQATLRSPQGLPDGLLDGLRGRQAPVQVGVREAVASEHLGGKRRMRDTFSWTH